MYSYDAIKSAAGVEKSLAVTLIHFSQDIDGEIIKQIFPQNDLVNDASHSHFVFKDYLAHLPCL